MSGWLSVDEALNHLRKSASGIEVAETLSLKESVGRILANDQLATVNVPPADNSAMDGFAVRSKDINREKTVVVSQRIPAGKAALPLKPGTAARIFTGAEIPIGADAVVMQEECEYSQDRSEVKINDAAVLRPGCNVRRTGESLRCGEILLPQGTRIRGPELGLLASSGITEVPVYRRLSVAIIATGDELVEPGTPLEQGQIYNASQSMLFGLLSELNIEVVDLGCVGDTVAETEQALQKAASLADCILTVGGVSVGEEDHVKTALAKLGEQAFWKISIKPGKPLAFGSVNGIPFFGLPGNPVSSFITFVLFTRPYLQAMQGQAFLGARKFFMQAGFSFNKAGLREEYLRGYIEQQDGIEIVVPYKNQSSGVLTSICRSDVLVVIPVGECVVEGALIQVIPLNSLC